MHDHQAVCGVEHHVQPLPNRRRQEGEPEIVAGRRQQEHHRQAGQPERLDRKADELAVVRPRRQFGKEVRQCSLRLIPFDHEPGMQQGHCKRQNAKMTAIE